ncbi:MAG: hypothetical protein PVJ76_05930 [Gemmatimonadota bacterium]
MKHYTQLAALVEKEGLAHLKLQLEERATDEGQHGQEMRRLMG